MLVAFAVTGLYSYAKGTDMNPFALTVPEAVRASGLSRTAIYLAMREGLPARKSGKRTLILAKDLEAYLANLPPYQAEG